MASFFPGHGVHCVSKKRVNFETVYLKIIGLRIDFDDIWQKHSKYSRIEFVCFSFRAGLLFLNSTKLFLRFILQWALSAHKLDMDKLIKSTVYRQTMECSVRWLFYLLILILVVLYCVFKLLIVSVSSIQCD